MPPDNLPIQPFVVEDGIAIARPEGPATLVEAVELMRQAIAHCRERHIKRLLFNSTGLTGVAMPSLVDRFLMVEEWAHTAKGMVRVALVTQPERIHPEKFGVTLAHELGLAGDVFTTEAPALRWLASSAAAQGPYNSVIRSR